MPTVQCDADSITSIQLLYTWTQWQTKNGKQEIFHGSFGFLVGYIIFPGFSSLLFTWMHRNFKLASCVLDAEKFPFCITSIVNESLPQPLHQSMEVSGNALKKKANPKSHPNRSAGCVFFFVASFCSEDRFHTISYFTVNGTYDTHKHIWNENKFLSFSYTLLTFLIVWSFRKLYRKL